jgi:hypothetical protein
MRIVFTIRIAVAISACAALLVLTVWWPEYLESASDRARVHEAAMAAVCAPETLCVVDYARVPSTAEVIVRISIALIALADVAAVASTGVRMRKVLVGAIASASSALLACVFLQAVVAAKFDQVFVPGLNAVVVASCAIASLIGGATSWGIMKWWHNKSPERARGG